MMPSVLISCPVNKVKDYCIEDYLDNATRITYPNKQFYFVDNSLDESWHIETFIANGFECDYISPVGKRNQEYICECQNKIRLKALEKGFDYLLFLECDVFPEPFVLTEMLAYNAPVVACNYFVGHDEYRQLLKMEIEGNAIGDYTNRNISQLEGFLEHGTGKTRSNMSGYGCALIHKSILKRFEFHTHGKVHSDSFFYFDLHANGIKTIVHSYIAEHRNSRWEQIKDK